MAKGTAMKRYAWTVAALALAGASMSWAQTTLTPPEPVMVTLPVEVIPDRMPPTPESPADARIEAKNSYAEAKAECRHQPSRAAQSECLRQAREDYDRLMARASGRL